MSIDLYLLSQRLTQLMFGLIAIAYIFSPLFLIRYISKSKKIGRVKKKIILFVLIVMVFLLVTNRLLSFIGNEINNSMINDPANR